MAPRALLRFALAPLTAGIMLAACVGDTATTPQPDAGADGGVDSAADSSVEAQAPVEAGGDVATADASDASTCGDGKRDGDETDVDCGGSCGVCALGKKCLVTSDCASGGCTNLVCSGWQRSLSGTGTEHGNGVAVDAQGNVYVAGDFFVDLNLGPNGFTKLISSGSCDAFVAKLAPNGDHLWSRRFGGLGCDSAYAVAVDPQGDAYVVGGSVSPSLDLGQGPVSHLSAQNYDLFVMRLSTVDGAPKWAKAFGAGTLPNEFGIPRSYGITVDGAGKLWVAANATSPCDYGGGSLPPTGAEDALVLRLAAADGSFASAKLQGGAQGDGAQAVTADANGVYVGGYFGTSIDFGLGALNATGGHDAFVVAYDLTGAPKWQRALGGTNPARPFGPDRVHAIHSDPAGNVYVAGMQSGGPMNLGNNVTAPDPAGGLVDIFAASYKSDGTPRWVTAFGGPQVDTAYGLVADGAGSVILAGYTESPTLDVGSGPVTHGLGHDAYVSVLSDSTGVPKQGRFLGRASTSECSALARRPATSSVYVVGTFSGSLQALTALSAGDAGAADLVTATGPDGFVASLGNAP